MTNQINSWLFTLIKLGFVQKKSNKIAPRSYLARRLRMEALENRQMLATTWTVNIDVDERDGIADGQISLRDAIDVAVSGDTIDFNPTQMNGATITLDRTKGHIVIDGDSITIDASMLPAGVTIDANDPTPLNQSPGEWGDGNRIFNIVDPTMGQSPPLVTIIGLTLTGGDPNPNDGSPDGGAIRSTARLKLVDCTVSDNFALNFGGGIWVNVADNGDPINPRPAVEALRIEQSVIENNSAAVGGGVYLQSVLPGTVVRDTSIITGDTQIRGNAAESNGGGLYANLYQARLTIEDSAVTSNNGGQNSGGIFLNYHGGSVTITGCDVSNNVGGIGGGGLGAHLENASLQIEGSTFADNRSALQGGGISLRTEYDGGDSSISIADSEITGNKVSTIEEPIGDGGGGIFGMFDRNVSFSINNSIISDNRAYGGSGGGVKLAMPYSSGYSGPPNGNRVTLDKVVITGNTAPDDGGGLFANVGAGDQQVSLIDCTIRDNHATNGDGGGMFFELHSSATDPSSLSVAGSEISENTAGDGGGGMAVFANGSGTRVSAYNSTFSGNSADTEGGGVLMSTNDPNADFGVDARFENVTITENTADIGAGLHSLVPTDPDGRNQVRLTNSIVSANETGDVNPTASNLYGSFDIVHTVFNIIGSGSAFYDYQQTHLLVPPSAQNIFTDEPGLKPLAYNGGFTRTHELECGSPAIDAGSNPLAVIPFETTLLEFDQRGPGFTRLYDALGFHDPGGPIVDIGAYEMDCICVSNLTDEFDTDFSYGDLSLREAVNYANNAGVPTKICLPTGLYQLTLAGTGGVSQGDLDITGNVTVVGDGAGLSVIDASGLVTTTDRIFDVASDGTLNLSRVTLTGGKARNATNEWYGGAIIVRNLGTLNLSESAVVRNEANAPGADGGGIYFCPTAMGTITNSVVTENQANDMTGGIHLASNPPNNPAITLTSTVVVNNMAGQTAGADVKANGIRTFTSGGNNRLGNTTTGLVHDPNGNGDYVRPVGTIVDYVVTGIADTYDGTTDKVVMSLRDAIHQANITAGAQEIWLPAWSFVLTRERNWTTHPTDMDVSTGDLDIKQTLVIRGVSGSTTVAWRAGAAVDKVFELLGDYNSDGVADVSPSDVDGSDYVIWRKYNGMVGPDLPADGNDDGVVNDLDYDVWSSHYGNTLMLRGVVA